MHSTLPPMRTDQFERTRRVAERRVEEGVSADAVGGTGPVASDAMALFMILFRVLVTDTGIQHQITEIDQQVDQHVNQRKEQRDGLDQREVA